uniref:ditrans,polycis-polyprenyl diphosphate synthase [(2E,6E)-farnesyldiphosphate specific] n=1 Tax=Lutzomyia longipalpis TaxID=7200 RepID=A0A7G3AP17_LUTLO
MSLGFLYKAAWLLLHFIFSIVEAVIFYRKFLVRKFKQFSWSPQHDGYSKNPAEFIKLHRDYLDKIPTHLAVILGLEEPNFEVLSNLIYWAMASEISYISIYDHKEILQAHQEDFREFVLRRQTIPGRVTFIPAHDGSDANGFKNQIKVRVLSRADGKPTIGNLCRTLSQEVQRGQLQLDQIDVELVDKRLSDMTGRIPDPEVAVYTGDFCCTYGFLPWQSRLTEFIPMGPQNLFGMDTFLNVLYQYAKKEQRFGK